MTEPRVADSPCIKGKLYDKLFALLDDHETYPPGGQFPTRAAHPGVAG